MENGKQLKTESGKWKIKRIHALIFHFPLSVFRYLLFLFFRAVFFEAEFFEPVLQSSER